MSMDYGYCHCGCGEKTALAMTSNARIGRVKGEPNRFISGHNARVDHPAWGGDEDRREAFLASLPASPVDDATDIPLGYCQCGCGEKTYVPQRSNRAKGWIKGVPTRFKRGHISRVRPTNWSGDDATYEAVHARVFNLRGSAKNYRCAMCEQQADEWAYDHSDPNEKRDPLNRPFSTDLDTYRPLCRSCHRREDASLKTECVNGHPYDDVNTWIGPKGQRGCRACNREKHAQRKARLRAEAAA